jgi:hypothetical protein
LCGHIFPEECYDEEDPVRDVRCGDGSDGRWLRQQQQWRQADRSQEAVVDEQGTPARPAGFGRLFSFSCHFNASTVVNTRSVGILLLALLIGSLAAGCGPSRKPGANQDNDRPKPTEKK